MKQNIFFKNKNVIKPHLSNFLLKSNSFFCEKPPRSHLISHLKDFTTEFSWVLNKQQQKKLLKQFFHFIFLSSRQSHTDIKSLDLLRFFSFNHPYKKKYVLFFIDEESLSSAHLTAFLQDDLSFFFFVTDFLEARDLLKLRHEQITIDYQTNRGFLLEKDLFNIFFSSVIALTNFSDHNISFYKNIRRPILVGQNDIKHQSCDLFIYVNSNEYTSTFYYFLLVLTLFQKKML